MTVAKSVTGRNVAVERHSFREVANKKPLCYPEIGITIGIT
jgi:hypothetical protein